MADFSNTGGDYDLSNLFNYSVDFSCYIFIMEKIYYKKQVYTIYH